MNNRSPTEVPDQKPISVGSLAGGAPGARLIAWWREGLRVWDGLPRGGWWLMFISLATALVIQALPTELARRLTAESGPFETMSALLLGAALLLGLAQWRARPEWTRFAGVLLLLWAVLRELDFQKRFTYRSVESLGYYFRPIAPWWEKVLVLLLLAPFFFAGCHLAWLAWRHLRSALPAREPWLALLTAAAGLIFIGALCEKLLGLHVAEEVLETGFAAFIVMLVWSFRGR